MAIRLSTTTQNPDSINNVNVFYFHALKRDQDGLLHYTTVKSTDNDTIEAYNMDGTPIVDIMEGNDYVQETTPEKSYLNSPEDRYQQFVFDKRKMTYFIDNDGYLVARFGDYDHATEGPK